VQQLCGKQVDAIKNLPVEWQVSSMVGNAPSIMDKIYWCTYLEQVHPGS